MKNNTMSPYGGSAGGGQLWQKFKFGIFDVDGTLFDNMPLSADAFSDVINNFNLPEEEIRKIYLETNGMNLDDQFKLVFDKYKVQYRSSDITRLNKKFFETRDNSEEWKNSPLFSGIKELLEKLSGNGVKNFISSGSNTDEVASRLKNAEIANYFDLILGAEKIPKGPRHFEEFAAYCGVPIEEFSKNAFLSSDGANDMTLAKNAGIFAIGVANTLEAEKLISAGAGLVIKDARELLSQKL